MIGRWLATLRARRVAFRREAAADRRVQRELDVQTGAYQGPDRRHHTRRSNPGRRKTD